jgi:large subunit ribosomal protein L28
MISHSKAHVLRKWYPNELNKKVFSYAMNDWIRFKMTARALRNIDHEGGIDNYILNLDEFSVSESNYITKVRSLIATSLFHQGLLDEKHIKKMKFDKFHPPSLEKLQEFYATFKKEQQVPKQQDGYHRKIALLRQTAGIPVKDISSPAK